jgi:hypothetical protein
VHAVGAAGMVVGRNAGIARVTQPTHCCMLRGTQNVETVYMSCNAALVKH